MRPGVASFPHMWFADLGHSWHPGLPLEFSELSCVAAQAGRISGFRTSRSLRERLGGLRPRILDGCGRSSFGFPDRVAAPPPVEAARPTRLMPPIRPQAITVVIHWRPDAHELPPRRRADGQARPRSGGGLVRYAGPATSPVRSHQRFRTSGAPSGRSVHLRRHRSSTPMQEPHRAVR